MKFNILLIELFLNLNKIFRVFKMIYNTYLFANIVNDLVINMNDWSIPYDLSYPIVLQAYEEFMNFDFDENLSTHDSMVNFINSNEELYSSLRDLAE